MEISQIAVVQETFKQVLPIRETAADLFYNRLFELEPATRVLFTGDMKEQGVKLMAALAVVVAGLTAIETIVPTVQDLAVRHVGYGVEDKYYETVGEALIWTLEQGLGDAFTDEAREAWLAAYTTLAGVMIAAAGEHREGGVAVA
jgi:nitric oxide dioxygenase